MCCVQMAGRQLRSPKGVGEVWEGAQEMQEGAEVSLEGTRPSLSVGAPWAGGGMGGGWAVSNQTVCPENGGVWGVAADLGQSGGHGEVKKGAHLEGPQRRLGPRI